MDAYGAGVLKAADAHPVRTRWAAVVGLGLAMLVVNTELTISSVTLPGIAADLGVGPTAATWMLLGYALPMGAAAIPLGRWIDQADVCAVFRAAIIGTALTGTAAAAAPTFAVLVVARVAQGLAGGLIMAAYLPLIALLVHPAQRGRALGQVATIMTLGALAGVPLGGLVAEFLGWRQVMLLKLPVLAVALVLAPRGRPASRRRVRWPVPDREQVTEAVLLIGAVTALLAAVDLAVAHPGFAVLPVPVAGLAAAAWVRRPGAAPVVALIRRPAVTRVAIAVLANTFTSGLIAFSLPYFVADVMGGGPVHTGVVLACFVGVAAPFATLAGVLVDRHGTRWVAAAGSAFTVMGMLTMLTVGSGTGIVGLAWRLSLLGAGMGLFTAPINAAWLAAAPPGMAGLIGGLGMTVRTLSLTGGPVVAGVCWAAAGGGVAGFRCGVAVLTAVAVVGLISLCRPDPTRRQITVDRVV
ncbi:MAG TPA: MFS transporter [Sporichthyaceae bacterium]